MVAGATIGSMRARTRGGLAAGLLVLCSLLGLGIAPPPAGADGNEAPGNPAAARGLSLGSSHVCAILATGSVRCWGDNGAGQLGQGDTASRGDGPDEMGAFLSAVGLGTGRTATAIAAGALHTCARLDNGTVKCWGNNTTGQLGQGSTTNLGDGPGEMGDSLPAIALGTGRTATAITAGANHTCALLDNGTVKCWGSGAGGRLGQGSTTTLGDGAGEMGDNLPAIALGTGRTATAISAGSNHTCALLDNGTAKCWGSGSGGRLGQGSTSNLGDGAGEMGDDLPAIALGTGRTATAISAGGSHTCARLDNGVAKCWGSGSNGKLGQGTVVNPGHTAGEMGDSLPAIALGTGRTATAVTTGDFATCARLDDGTVKCWGSNAGGVLGLGDTANRGDNAGEMGDNLPAVFLPPAGLISGTVTDSVSGQPIPDVEVAVLRTSDFGLAGSALTDVNGNYTAQAPPGSYFLYLLDFTAGHPDGFFGAPGATTVFVADGGNSDTDPTMVPSRGSFSGTVTDQAAGIALAGVAVFAIGPNGVVGGTATAANGTYTITNLPVGNYHAVFVDGAGRRNVEYYTNSPDFAGSIPFAVAGANNTPNIDAALFKP